VNSVDRTRQVATDVRSGAFETRLRLGWGGNE
jgi:hypothetical protein